MRSVHLVVGLSLVVCAGCAAEPGEDLDAEELAAEQEVETRSDDRGARHCPDEPRRVETLADAAARADRLFGAAVSFDALTAEPEYRAILEAEFNDVTPENATKWGPLQPVSPDEWAFEQADAIIDAAEDADQGIKGHTLVWHSQVPPFVNDSLPAELLRQYVQQHIDKVVRRYRRDIRAWDVVNEAIDDAAGMRDTVFLRKLGPGYIADAFRRAHRADRNADLYYNDYNIEDINPKSDAVYELVSSLLAEGVPIHGVGVQGHIEGPAAPTYEGMVANFQRFADLGLTVNISELDVRIARLPGDLQTRLAVQKQIYHRVVAACVQVPGCVGITTWGFTDRHSWVDGVFGPDDPLPYDDLYRRKPAYHAIADGFMGVPPDPPGTAPNLVANSAFEIGGEGWAASGGALDTTEAQAHTGASSARVKARTAETDGPAHDLRAVVTPGRGYDVSAWTRVSAPSGAVRLVATTRCAGGPELVTTLDSDVAGNRGWVELTGELLAPGCALDQLAIRVDGPAAGVTLYVDDVAVRPQPGDFGPNLIANPDFESGTTGWFGFGGPTLAASTAEAHGGARSGFVSNRTASFQGPGTSLLGLAFPDGTYRASTWARLSGAESGPAILTLKASCAGTDQFIRIATGTATSTAWTEVSGTFTVPDCALTELTMYLEGPPAGVDQYIDDVSVRQDLSELEPNIVANPGFESGTASWFGFGGPTLTAQAAQAHSGALSVLVTNRTATFQGPGQSLLAAATAGSYAASGWVRLANLAAAPIQMTLKTSCDGVDQFAAIGSANATDAGWTRISGTLQVASCTLTDLVLYFEGPAAGVEFFVDDVTVRKLPSPEPTPQVWPAR